MGQYRFLFLGPARVLSKIKFSINSEKSYTILMGRVFDSFFFSFFTSAIGNLFSINSKESYTVLMGQVFDSYIQN